MNKEILSIALAFGCVAANAANVNYDLLGRKGSKMNSPMVYKNVDYSKMKKNDQQNIGSSLNNHALLKTGMPDNIKAIKGSYLTNQSTAIYEGSHKLYEDAHYTLKRYYANNSENCSNSHFCTYDWNDYRNAVNKNFIEVNIDRNTSPSYESAVTSNSASLGYSYSDKKTVNDNHLQESPYAVQAGQIIQYKNINNVVDENSQATYYSWFNRAKSDVGIYMDAAALPTDIGSLKNVKYVKNGSSSFSPMPGNEMDATRTYKILKKTAERTNSVIYVGSGNPSNITSATPQIYIGVRNKHVSAAVGYGTVAKNLDNFIYANRTIEIAAAGDNGAHVANAKPKLNSYAYATNAITVGAFDPINESVLSYTSTANNKGSAYSAYKGSKKPEIYNYSNVYTDDYTRTYTKNGSSLKYRPLYDGTRIAAAYTAGMVANLLAVNPFYRWHPEVVKALLLTQEKTVPSYRYVAFNEENHDMYDYDSRYWNGDINSLKTRTNADGKPEIWFVAQNLGSVNYPAAAAISWLSSGNDISKIGHIPQNFDLYVYGSNDNDYSCYEDPYIELNEQLNCGNRKINFDFAHPGVMIASSHDVYNSYERVKIASNYKHLVFKIVLKDEDSRSENKGQIVLGFNMSSPYYGR